MRLTNLRSCFSPRLRAVDSHEFDHPHFPDCLVKTRLGEHGWGHHLVTFFAVSGCLWNRIRATARTRNQTQAAIHWKAFTPATTTHG